MSEDSDLEEQTIFNDTDAEREPAAAPPPRAPMRLEETTEHEPTESVRSERDTQIAPLSGALPAAEADLAERTGFATESMKVALLFAHRFGKRTVGGTGQYLLRLSEPGVSTDGGAKARQSITLSPKNQSMGAIVIGWVDLARAIAELKSYALVAEQQRQRKGEALGLSREEYETLQSDLQRFFRESGVTPSIVDRQSGGLPPVSEVAVSPRMIAGI